MFVCTQHVQHTYRIFLCRKRFIQCDRSIPKFIVVVVFLMAEMVYCSIYFFRCPLFSQAWARALLYRLYWILLDSTTHCCISSFFLLFNSPVLPLQFKLDEEKKSVTSIHSLSSSSCCCCCLVFYHFVSQFNRSLWYEEKKNMLIWLCI